MYKLSRTMSHAMSKSNCKQYVSQQQGYKQAFSTENNNK